MLGKRSFVTQALVALAAVILFSGCPGDVGLTLLVSPDKLDFGTTENVLTLKASKNFSGSTLQPVIAKASASWIIPQACADTADQCFSGGPIDDIEIPVRVDRAQMTLGTNRGYVYLEGGGASSEKVEVIAYDLIQTDFSAATRTPAVGRSVQFTDLSVSSDEAGAITRRLWDFGDGTTSPATNPAHIYTTAGEYTVTLTVWAGTHTESLARPAFITAGNTPPVVDFEASATTITERDEVTFYDLSTSSAAPIVERVWDFGDGHTSTEARPTVQYSTPGLYTISLTVTTSLGASDTETKTNYIIVQQAVAPKANFALSQVSPYVLVSVQFTDLSDPGTAPILNWVWEFGDEVISTEQNPSHIYKSVGDFEVKLTVITEHGYDSKTVSISVVDKPPTAAFSVDDTNPSTNAKVQFTDASLAGISSAGTAVVDQWWWNFGDGGTSREQNPTHKYTREGTYTVTLKVGSSALPADVTDTEVKTDYIQVFAPPVPAFAVLTESPFTKDTLEFTNKTTAGTETAITYQWDFGDGTDVVTGETPTHVYSSPGTYEITMTATTPTRSAKTAQSIVVDARPSPAFSATPTSGITVDPVQFTDETPTAHVRPVETRLWSFGDGGISTAANPTHTYAAVGQYTVSLKITYSHSVSHDIFTATVTKTNYITITLPTAPTASFSVDATCATPGQLVTFTDASEAGSAGSIASYLWDFGDGTSSVAANPTHSYTKVGDYSVTLTVTTSSHYAPYNTASVTQTDLINCHHETTDLDTYVAAADPSYAYSVVDSATETADLGSLGTVDVDVHVVALTSQTWRSTADYRVVGTNSATWQHYMTVVAPHVEEGAKISNNTALLFIDGGGNGGSPPAPGDTDKVLWQMAAATDSVVIDLKQVPNESVEFVDEAGLRTRSEDEIISRTYDKWLDGYSNGDAHADYYNWPLLLPMVKSAVRAMDTVQDMYTTSVLPPATGTQSSVGKFVVSGGSKRGWTTWLTGAFEQGPLGQKRVAAIAPIVIDILNMPKQLEHHRKAYGYWSPAIYPYAQEQVFDRFADIHPQHAAGLELLEVVDPFKYRCRLEDTPKYLMNSSGDQFFLPDAAQWYFDKLGGEKYVNYIPNSSHGLDGFDDLTDITNPIAGLASFYASVITGTSRPDFTWTFNDDGSISVDITSGTISAVTLWSSTNTTGRDFRYDKGHTWSSRMLTATSKGHYKGSITAPTTGYAAFFLQLKFVSGLPAPASLFPYYFTTPIRVLPENADGTNKYPEFNGTRQTLGSGVDSVPMVVVYGTPEEMGKQYGSLMSTEINANIPAFLAAAQAKYPAMTNSALDAAWDAIAAAYDPSSDGTMSRFEEELIGVAEGAGLYDASTPAVSDGLLMLRRANMVPVLATMADGLSVGSTRSAAVNGYTYQACSLNWALDLGLQDYPCIVLYVPDLAMGFPHANVTFAGLVGALTGINIAGVALSGVQDPAVAGDPGPAALVGKHYSTLLRDVLYDSRNSRTALNTFFLNEQFHRQHIVISDGRYLRQNFKVITGLAGFQPFIEDDPADEYAPHTVPYTVYAGPESGAVTGSSDGPAISLLNTAYGIIGTDVLEQVCSLFSSSTNNLLTVVYEEPDDDLVLNLHVAYANGSQPATARQIVTVNLQDYLP